MKFILVCILALCSCKNEKTNIKAIYEQVYRDFERKIRFDPFVLDYFSTIAPLGNPIFYAADTTCSVTNLGKFIAKTPLFGSEKAWLIEENGILDSIHTITNKGETLFLPEFISSRSLKSYFNSDIIDGCYLVFRKPLTSHNRYWIEVNFCTRISSERLSLLLVYDKDLDLKHILRMRENATSYDACLLEEQLMIWDYNYSNSYWVGEKYFESDTLETLRGIE